jgi:hypothetical protein
VRGVSALPRWASASKRLWTNMLHRGYSR